MVREVERGAHVDDGDLVGRDVEAFDERSGDGGAREHDRVGQAECRVGLVAAPGRPGAERLVVQEVDGRASGRAGRRSAADDDLEAVRFGIPQQGVERGTHVEGSHLDARVVLGAAHPHDGVAGWADQRVDVEHEAPHGRRHPGLAGRRVARSAVGDLLECCRGLHDPRPGRVEEVGGLGREATPEPRADEWSELASEPRRVVLEPVGDGVVGDQPRDRAGDRRDRSGAELQAGRCRDDVLDLVRLVEDHDVVIGEDRAA